MKIQKEDFLSYITFYEEDELFYQSLYNAENASEKALNDFLDKIDYEYVKKHSLYVPQLHDGWFPYMGESDIFSSLKQNIVLLKHYRYSPYFEHEHAFFEVIFVYQGQCTNIIQGDSKELKTGDVCIIPPRTKHSIGVFNDSIIINIMIKASTFQSTFFQLFSGNNILADFFSHILFKKTSGNYLKFSSGNDEQIRSLIEDMFIEYMGHEKYTDSILNNMLMLFWGYLLRRHEDHFESFLSSDHGSLQMAEVLTYLQKNYRDITLQKTAEHFGFSEPHFSKLIKESTGKNFTKIIKDAKLEQACYALKNTKLSIASICEIVGYPSPEHFMRTFKKEFGCTPSQYRNFSKCE